METKVPGDHKSHHTALCVIKNSPPHPHPIKIILLSMIKLYSDSTWENEEERGGEEMHSRRQKLSNLQENR